METKPEPEARMQLMLFNGAEPDGQKNNVPGAMVQVPTVPMLGTQGAEVLAE
jgi:hypothetical protein